MPSPPNLWLRELIRWKCRSPRELPVDPLSLTELVDDTTAIIKQSRIALGLMQSWITNASLAHDAKLADETSAIHNLVSHFTQQADEYSKLIIAFSVPQAGAHLRTGVHDYLALPQRRAYVVLICRITRLYENVFTLVKEYEDQRQVEALKPVIEMAVKLLPLARAEIAYRNGARELPPDVGPHLRDTVVRMADRLQASELEHRTSEEEEEEEEDDDDDESLSCHELFSLMLRNAQEAVICGESIVTLLEAVRNTVNQRVNSSSCISALDSFDQNRQTQDSSEMETMTSSKASSFEGKRRFVLLLHGIRDPGNSAWQDLASNILEANGFETIKPNYGYFNALQFLNPFLNVQPQLDIIQSALDEAGAFGKDVETSVVAHSFGTYLLIKLLQETGVGSSMRFHRIILCGSVLNSSDAKWHAYRNRSPYPTASGEDAWVIYHCGDRDKWPARAAILGWYFGSAGSFGLNDTPLVKHRFHKGGHNLFFTADHITNYWLPFLKDGTNKSVPPGEGKQGYYIGSILHIFAWPPLKYPIRLIFDLIVTLILFGFCAVVIYLIWAVAHNFLSTPDHSNLSAEAFASNACEYANNETNLNREADGIRHKTVKWRGNATAAGQETYGGKALPYLKLQITTKSGCSWEVRAFLDCSFEKAREYVGQNVNVAGLVEEVDVLYKRVKIFESKVTVF